MLHGNVDDLDRVSVFVRCHRPRLRPTHPRPQCLDSLSRPAYVDPSLEYHAPRTPTHLYQRGRLDPPRPVGARGVVGRLGPVGGRPLLPAGVLLGAADDTLWHKTGRHVTDAGYWRDGVRSTETQVVKAWGLNVVLLVVIWSPHFIGPRAGSCGSGRIDRVLHHGPDQHGPRGGPNLRASLVDRGDLSRCQAIFRGRGSSVVGWSGSDSQRRLRVFDLYLGVGLDGTSPFGGSGESVGQIQLS